MAVVNDNPVFSGSAIAVIGITGPDDLARRAVIREAWSVSPPHGIVLRFAVSSRDKTVTDKDDADVHHLDCLGQASGLAVVEIALADAWYRFAVDAYPTVPFVGRADTDVVVAPAWLDMALRGLLATGPPNSSSSRFYYVGRVAWYHWHEREFRPMAFGFNPAHAASVARVDEPCKRDCWGPFPFATGPLILLSRGLARWYAHSHTAQRALQAAIDSRRSRSDGRLTVSASEDTRAGAASEVFLKPSAGDDLHVRLFDDVFLGWAIFKGGAPNVTVLRLPLHGFTDAPAPCNAVFSVKASPRSTACCLQMLNASHATVVHMMKDSPWLFPAVAKVIADKAPRKSPIRCGTVQQRVKGAEQLAHVASLRWCTLPTVRKTRHDQSLCTRGAYWREGGVLSLSGWRRGRSRESADDARLG
jgi:hypothetical protein